MPSCPEILALLADFLEGRLPERERRSLERHLSDCPGCEAALSTYRATVGLLHSLREEDLPRELRLRLRAYLDKTAHN
ncbi:MAG TPA: zf-HC2 domain-containing protein [Vicinamibacterales bacterium]|jgi:anti-sigma factor RsiW